MRRILIAAVLTVGLVTGIVLIAVPRAVDGSPAAAPTVHVHLGDSYAAGTGLSPLVADSPFVCQRSTDNFGQLLARARGWQLTDVSCAGADTADLTQAQYEGVPEQLAALDARTDVVTLTLGGNNADLFATAVGQCTRLGPTDRTGEPCREALGERLFAVVEEQLPGELTAAFRAITEAAPNARVLIAGYPWALPATGGCFAEVSIAAGDVPFVRELQTGLNATVQQAAERSGAVFVDLAEVSAGRDACAGADRRWIEPMIGGSGAMHPNARGQQGIADAVAAALTG